MFQNYQALGSTTGTGSQYALKYQSLIKSKSAQIHGALFIISSDNKSTVELS